MLTNLIRGLKGNLAALVVAPLFVAMVASIIFTAGWGIYDDTLLRVGTLTLACIILLYLRLVGADRSWYSRLFDALLIVAVVGAAYRYFWVSEELETGLYELERLDLAYASGGLIALAVLVRRFIGTPLLLVCIGALLYALFGNQLPGALAHAGIDFSELYTTVWYSFDGVFGGPLAVVTSTILVFILFGALLEGLGVGEVLLKLSFRLTRRFPGGDAHAAVLGSSLFGTISGSAVANVVGTGVITIPMIIKRGFSRGFAGAVEAAASSGGQLMPPIMGAVAFIMADVTGLPYLSICIAAVIPALFYYGSLFAFISAEAKSLGMRSQSADEVESLSALEKRKVLAFVVPLGLIVILMMQGSSPAQAGFWALISAAVLGVAIDPALLRQPRQLWSMIASGAKASSTIMVAVASVGVIIAVMNGTGLGLRFAEAIQSVAGDSLFLSLVLTAMGCLVLGMGMPTVPAYLVIILVMGPTVSSLGVETIAAHLFVVYYAVLSAVTPPVALASFAAAPIAGANPMRVSVTSLRLAVIGFIIPFAFVYNPSLLLINESFSMLSLIIGLVTTTVAVCLVSAFFSGRGVLRWVYLVAGLAVVSPYIWVQAAAVLVFGLMFVSSRGKCSRWRGKLVEQAR